MLMTAIYKSEEGRREVLEQYRAILENWPVDNRQYVVDTSFGRTFIIESGDSGKPPLILLHGSASNSHVWFSDVAALSKHYRVYAIDMIGEAGLSEASRPSYQSGAYPQWLNEVMQALGLSTCSMVAMSLGGWMALSFAADCPDKVDRLVLLCPGGLAQAKASFVWKAVFFSLLGKWGQLQTLKLVGGGASATSSSRSPGNLALASLTFKHFKPRRAKLPLFSDQSLQRLTMPVLMLFGDQDQLIPAKQSMKRLQRCAPLATVEMLPQTGHLILNQTDRILRFLARQGS